MTAILLTLMFIVPGLRLTELPAKPAGYRYTDEDLHRMKLEAVYPHYAR